MYSIPKFFRTSWLVDNEEYKGGYNAAWPIYSLSPLQPKLPGVALYVNALTSAKDVMAYFHWISYCNGYIQAPLDDGDPRVVDRISPM